MSDNEKETQVAEETQNTQATAESNNEDRKNNRRGQRGEGRRGELDEVYVRRAGYQVRRGAARERHRPGIHRHSNDTGPV